MLAYWALTTAQTAQENEQKFRGWRSKKGWRPTPSQGLLGARTNLAASGAAMLANMTPNPRGRVVRAAALCAMAAALLGADAPTGGDPRVHAFVLNNIYIAGANESDRCPVLADGGLEAFLKMLPPEEQAKYATPDRRAALEKEMFRRLGFRRVVVQASSGVSAAKLPASYAPDAAATPQLALEIGAVNGFPKGRGRFAFQNHVVAYDSCTNPEEFPQLAKGFRTYEGKVAVGLNLDGKATREDFAGTDGARGVDNQLWRAMGCVKTFRESGDPKLARKTIMSARAPTIIELRGVDDLKNDLEVQVDIYGGADPIIRDGRGQPLPSATYRLDPDPQLHASTRGRIDDGVLTTEPVDVRLNFKEQILDAPRDLRGARLRATLTPDGRIEGGFFGYYTLDSFYRSIEQMTQNGANLSSLSCPGVRQAIDRLADGYRDRRSGRPTAISSALGFFGVRAFTAPAAPGRPAAAPGGAT